MNAPVPFHLKKLRGNPGQRRLRPEPEPELEVTVPDPPSYLSGYAADEWCLVATELYRMRLLTKVDTAVLAAYCTSYSRWRMALEALQKLAEYDPDTSGLIVKAADGNARQNPLVKIMSDAADDMLAFAGEFGLTPVARTRINAGSGWQPPSPSKFDGLLGPRA
jgi:P27 family predicted phage terminase small subunit